LLAATVTGSVQIGETIYFRNSDSAYGMELWKSNADGSDKQLVIDLFPGSGGADPRWLIELNGQLIFAAHGPGTGTELYTTDGTAAGTVLLKDLLPGEGGTYPTDLFVLNDHVIFYGVGSVSYPRYPLIGSTDGTAAGTEVLFASSAQSPLFKSIYDGSHFIGGDANGEPQLWQTDGTVGGTHLIGNHTLVIQATNGTDTISVANDVDGTSVDVTINGVTRSYDFSGSDFIEIHAGAGDDDVTVAGDFARRALIYGEAGNDTLKAGAGDDAVIGGAGDDSIVCDMGSDSLIGGTGVDTLDYSNRSQVSTNPSGFLVADIGEQDLPDQFERFIATDGNDDLYLSGTFLYVEARGGDDNIDLSIYDGINPVIRGGDGNDTLRLLNRYSTANIGMFTPDINQDYLPGSVYGDAGDDTFNATNDANEYFGGDGIDRIDYTSAANYVYGWTGTRWQSQLGWGLKGVAVSLDNLKNDGVWGDANVHSDIEQIVGSSAGDTLVAGAAPATLIGGAGNDSLVGGAAADSLDGGAGQDTLIGGAGGDAIVSDSSDTITADLPPVITTVTPLPLT
jgi:ELWxxDGT repeat protein